jgi:hypothetical protein
MKMHMARFCIVNIACTALVIAAQMQGWASMIFEADLSYLTSVITVVLLYGLALCAWKLWRMDRVVSRAFDPGDVKKAKEQVAAYIEGIRWLSRRLVELGLVGTVIGFIIAFSGMDADVIGDVDSASAMIGVVITGMGVALYTTLVGMLASLWLHVNYRVLRAAALAAYVRHG